MKWKPEIILNGLQIASMKIDNLLFIDSVSYLPMPLRNLPKAFGLSLFKSWYPEYFNNNTYLNYVGPILDVSYFDLMRCVYLREGNLCHGTTIRRTNFR